MLNRRGNKPARSKASCSAWPQRPACSEPPVPVLLPTGTSGLPPLGGGLFAAFRAIWWALLIAALAAVAWSWTDAATPPIILALKLAKSAVLVAVAAILFRRRPRDPVAALLGLSFLLWTISSSVDFVQAGAIWPTLLDRLRFLPFALALLLFPNGEWRPQWTKAIAGAIVATFFLGCAEATGLLATGFYLPIAIGCVLVSLAALVLRYRQTEPGTQKQQLKWVSLGLFAGIGLILIARALAWLAKSSPMPLAGHIAVEGAFQLGIIVLALGFLVSLLRFRLYDAEAAISRSAIYAGLTLSVVGIFAAGESLIELVGQQYFGSSIGSVSGAVAAALAAILLTPLHGRISSWAEQYFQHDLAIFKKELPDLLAALSGGASLKDMATAVLPHIEKAVQATRLAILLDGKLVAVHGVGSVPVRRLLCGWQPAAGTELIDRDDDAPFPLAMALRCPLGNSRAWLLLGPRPDGSFYGRDDLKALAEIAAPLQRSLFLVALREQSEKRQERRQQSLVCQLASVRARLERLEILGPQAAGSVS